jgi:CBS domain-containing protein
MHSILVKDFMDSNPHALSEQASVRDAVLFLCHEKIAGAPVVNSEGIVVGYVSEKDCLTQILNDSFFCGESPSVTSVMTTAVRSVTPETSIVDIAQTMAVTAPRNYPVIDNNRLVGTITRSSVLAALVKMNEACYAQQ